MCSPFKNYFERLNHNANTKKKNGKTLKFLKVKLDFARRSFHFSDAPIFNSLPLSLRNTNLGILFRKGLDDFYL